MTFFEAFKNVVYIWIKSNESSNRWYKVHCKMYSIIKSLILFGHSLKKWVSYKLAYELEIKAISFRSVRNAFSIFHRKSIL